MAGGFKLSLIPDVGPFVAGMAKAEQSLDDTADALDDLARDAQRRGREAGQDIANGIDKGADRATDSVDDLTASFRDMAQAGARASRDTGDDIGRNIKRGTDEAEDGLGEFKDEAASTARETAASFDGSADSIAGAFQEVAANALGGFGPLGVAAGLALAAGIGTFWTKFNEDSEKAEERVSTMYDNMIESGNLFLDKSFVQTALQDIYRQTEDAAISWENLQKIVNETGLSQETVARAFAGDAEAGAQLTDTLNGKLGDQARVADEAAESHRQLGTEYYENNKRTQEAAELWRDQGAAIDDATSRAAGYQSAAVAAGVESVKSAEQAIATFDGLGRKISELPTANVKVHADTSDAERAIRKLTDGSYSVTVNGRVTGMRIV